MGNYEDVGTGQQLAARVDDIKSSTSDTSGIDVASQSDLQCLSVDAMYVTTPSPPTHYDNTLPTYQLASYDASPN